MVVFCYMCHRKIDSSMMRVFGPSPVSPHYLCLKCNKDVTSVWDFLEYAGYKMVWKGEQLDMQDINEENPPAPLPGEVGYVPIGDGPTAPKKGRQRHD